MEGQVLISVEKTTTDIYILKLLTAKILDELQIKEMEGKILSLIDSGSRKLILDFSNVEYLSSSVLGMLITIKKRLDEINGQIKLCCIKSQIFEVFRLTGLDKLFEIYNTCTEAISSFETQ